MKDIKIKILLHLLFALFCLNLQAQNVQQMEIKGIVVDASGQPVSGAIIRDDRSVVSTDETGTFTIATSPGTGLKIIALGYSPQTVIAKAQLKTITLISEADMVQVAFKKTERSELLGGVSFLNVPKLLEKNYYLSADEQLSSFLPGLNGNIWGNISLTMVDGVPRDIGNVLPTEIEQITVLKGAQAVALYGSQAARGVLLVTTKRGISGLNEFNVRANSGMYTPKRYPKYLGSADYMTLYNEARTNDGSAVTYSPETIAGTAAGTNKYRYPDVDYYSSEYLKKAFNRSDIVGEFRGGNDKTRFYANLGAYRLGSFLNVGEGKDESTTRFNVRGNVDIKFNNSITGTINTSLAYFDRKTAKGNYWGNAATLRPNWYTPLIPVSMFEDPNNAQWAPLKANPFLIDGQYLLGGRQDLTTTPFAAMYTQGPEKYTGRQFQFDAGLNFDLSTTLKGLSFKTLFGLDYLSRYTLSENINDYAVYNAGSWNGDKISYNAIAPATQGFLKIGENKVSRNRSLVDTYQRQVSFFTGQFNYNNTFGGVHNVTAMFIVNAFLRNISETYHGDGNANLGIQAGYNYKQKYYADFSGSYVHSVKFAPGHRDAFSPVGTLGWRISREEFLSGSDVIDDLKITGSAGILYTDMDYSNYNTYKGIYTTGGTAFRFNEGRQGNGTDVRQGLSPNMTFVQRKELNFGLDATLFNKSVQVTASYFRININGLPALNTIASPSYLVFGTNSTSFVSWENYNSSQYTGFDIGVNANKTVGKVALNLGVTATYATSKYTKIREVFDPRWPYLSKVGRPVDALWGLQSDGIFMNQTQINNAPPQQFNGTLQAGDIKYIDQNGDGKINTTNDLVYLGQTNPPLIMGVNFTAKWKKLTLFVLANGGFGGTGNRSNDYFRVRQERKYSEVVSDRTLIGRDATNNWEVKQLGTFPRLTTGAGANNFTDSDYWTYDNSYINLSKVQVSYDFPREMFKTSKSIKEMGIYVAGFDLLTIAKNRKILETNIGGAPQTRFFNLGIKASL